MIVLVWLILFHFIFCFSLLSLSLTLFFKEILQVTYCFGDQLVKSEKSKELEMRAKAGKPMQSSIWALQIKWNQPIVENKRKPKTKT